ncbi:bifunctional proline dehydrogenase/L-glutamate gamma-semialdehyde dehydrogenase PutA [Leucothrix arctica]|uniref:Bifunctional protein PutA n=1 Tax=Leucothrix arctica TaxID=1481894 RepID=A0A317CFK8_9GAMM|nr:bifunctional proline dehydrogenase/L-glutamate gamma-semialdehyde dehydrogenase PutA [Leucothrix arctica]PWQ97368.1 bifunctional proline dehydrogenase/L-glutamate gamma-semialdehyde dehydrogenase [Leucothrix arctica]
MHDENDFAIPFDVTTVHNDDAAWLTLSRSELFQNISQFEHIDEQKLISQFYDLAYHDSENDRVHEVAEEIITRVRSNHSAAFFDIEALLQEYSLSDEDGVTLMCLAEALLRVPDAATVDALIEDKLSEKEWKNHFSKDNSLFVNASTWGLMIAGNLVDVDESSISGFFKRSTKPVIRASVDRAMRIMGQHFVLGRTIKEAMKNAKPYLKKGYDYSYDMLGESAVTSAEALKYYNSYSDAIGQIAANSKGTNTRPTLSIKLSALHPRFEQLQEQRVLEELSATVEKLLLQGIENGVGITIDAEEADRLELTMKLFEHLYTKPFLKDWDKFGLVIQAYSKRALPVLCWLTKLSKVVGNEIPVRLVKGAYWDSEIQHAQELGFDGYPVYTRKEFTDTAYLACARYLLSDNTRGCIYPQFASHNAHTVSSVKVMAPKGREYEFQRLHGMGDSLYDSVLATADNINVRIYAPVGSHEDLLPYLVRRLLENGANSSFVHQLSDEATSIETLIKRPLTRDQITSEKMPIIKPLDIFTERKNSSGINLATTISRDTFMDAIKQFDDTRWTATPILNGESVNAGASHEVFSPYDNTQQVGDVWEADAALATQAIDIAEAFRTEWQQTAVSERAAIIAKLGDLLEDNRDELVALCQREAGKTIQDCIDEIREAVDFCRYYATQANERLVLPTVMPGPTGESNELFFEAKGIFVCISPWNFPLAIYLGQIVAALVSGNVVIAKPAETTALIAHRAAELLFEAGLPAGAMQFLPGSGAELGAVINADSRINGVVFTGSNKTAKMINLTLANRDDDAGLATLIAETGGLNAMLVDSTALPEQVAKDVVHSAFSSAGQRCSALRVLYVQSDIADRVIELVKGMMDEMKIGNPTNISTDVGPVIDKNAKAGLVNYIETMKSKAKSVYQVAIPDDCANGTFVAPTLLEIGSIKEMEAEQFGPILHVVRYNAGEIDQVVEDINSKKYGLTFGIHTRNTSLFQDVAKKIKVGNVYINRNQIGAVVGVNPFGGCGLSGTGPKAGGPNYLLRFVTEKTITNNTAAIGGNIDLLNAS